MIELMLRVKPVMTMTSFSKRFSCLVIIIIIYNIIILLITIFIITGSNHKRFISMNSR